jgi:putative hydrolase of the HAD superfamily
VAVSQAKTLWIREPYLDQILSGRKTIEVRVGYQNILRLQPGDQLNLNNQHRVTIRRIGLYDNFEDLLAHEETADIAPGLLPSELLAALREIYPPEKEGLGAVALELSLPRPYDVILFDMGYTLVHFEPPQEIIVQEALRAVGVKRTVEDIGAAVQVVWGEYYSDAATATFPATPEYDQETQSGLARNLLAQLGVEGTEETLKTYTDSIESWFLRPGVMRPYPEVADVLNTLKSQGYRLGIVSNWSWNLQDRVTQVELDGFFEIVWASAYAGCNKPHPDIFFQALARMQLPELNPKRVLYVGDSVEHDVVGARNAGLDVVLLDRNGATDAPDCPVVGELWSLLDLLHE